MARPFCCRRVTAEPGSNYFKPRGIPLSSLDEVTMTFDEFEAIRLADLEGFYQDQAAGRMGISRPTFGRILESAHKKVADALANGKALKIAGGEVMISGQRSFHCNDCQHEWNVPFGTGRPAECPQCKSTNIGRSAEERGFGRGRGMGMRRGKCWRHRTHRGIEGGQ